jgi:hypothetical protein
MDFDTYKYFLDATSYVVKAWSGRSVYFRRNMKPKMMATAPYFYGSILLRALESKIIVVLTYVSKK